MGCFVKGNQQYLFFFFFFLVVYFHKNSIIVVKWVHFVQTEVMAEIYSNSSVRAIGKVSLMKFS